MSNWDKFVDLRYIIGTCLFCIIEAVNMSEEFFFWCIILIWRRLLSMARSCNSLILLYRLWSMNRFVGFSNDWFAWRPSIIRIEPLLLVRLQIHFGVLILSSVGFLKLKRFLGFLELLVLMFFLLLFSLPILLHLFNVSSMFINFLFDRFNLWLTAVLRHKRF